MMMLTMMKMMMMMTMEQEMVAFDIGYLGLLCNRCHRIVFF